MTVSNDNPRRGWLVPLITFVIGLLVGLIVLGWWLWPVKWTHALPQDLRAGERDAYLIMVAESYASTGDGQTAKARLVTWPTDQLREDLTRLKARLSDDEHARQAAQVRQLEGLFGFQSGVTPPAPTAAAPRPAGATSQSNLVAQLRGICTAGVWVLLILMGIAAVILLWRRWRASQGPASGPAIGGSLRGPATPGRERADRTAEEIAAVEKDSWPAVPQAEPAEERSAAAPPPGIREEARPTVEVPAPTAVRQQPMTPAPRTAPVRSAPPAGAPLSKVGEFRSVYQMGEPDFDEAFDIAESSGAYIGQCGLELNDPIGRAKDQAAALQVWLWDTNDPDTKVKVLMSEGAYRDTALRDQLKGEHEAIQVRLGTEFELESYNLLLRGVVEKLDYAEQEPLYGVFAELMLRMQVYRKG